MRVSVRQYIDAVENSVDRLKILCEAHICRDISRQVKFISGGHAVVFSLQFAGRQYALKCYYMMPQRVKTICDYFALHPTDIVVRQRYLEQEICIFDRNDRPVWQDAVLMELADGMTLEGQLRIIFGNNQIEKLKPLAVAFDHLALALLRQPWAHGDVKPENIIVDDHYSMRLVDYDSAFLPCFAGTTTAELGSENYRHPQRDEQMFDKHVDDYSLAVISASLHTLVLCPDMYERYCDGTNIIFSVDGIFDDRDCAYTQAVELATQSCNVELCVLLNLLRSDSPRLDGIEALFAKLVDSPSAGQIAGELSPVCRNSKWGYEDSAGKMAVEAIFDQALEFSDGVAAVELCGRWHFIDRYRRRVFDREGWSGAKSFSEGFAAVKSDGLWGYIAADGSEAIPCIYAKAFSVRNSQATVIDTNGQTHLLNMNNITQSKIIES